MHLSSPIRAIRPAHPIFLDLITRVIFGEEYEHKAPRYVVFSTPLLARPMQFTTRLRCSDLGKIRLTPHHSESNCCVGQGQLVEGKSDAQVQ
jgi:hypothetical protein